MPNVFVGAQSGKTNTTGSSNTFLGYKSGYTNNGDGNTCLGVMAGYSSSSGWQNVFVGNYAGNTNTSGSYNTCIGSGADIAPACSTLTNMTAIGYGEVVAAAHGAYTMQLGSSAQTDIWCTSSTIHSASDGRFKFNVKEEVKGLEFINKLRPVIYQMDTKKLDDFIVKDFTDSIKTKHKKGMDFAPSTNRIHSGFIAQEVEKAAKDCGFSSSIVGIPSDSSIGYYGLNYSELVVPLVKAIQELSKKVDSLTTASKNQSIMQNTGNTGQSIAPTTIYDLELANSAVLFQNAPNPFGEGTTIKYFVPDNSNAIIFFYDEFGNKLKEFKIEEKGMGQLNISTMNLSAGFYSYSLVTDGKIVDTKKMIKSK